MITNAKRKWLTGALLDAMDDRSRETIEALMTRAVLEERARLAAIIESREWDDEHDTTYSATRGISRAAVLALLGVGERP